MLEVSGLGSWEQPQLVLSGVCDVLGVRCHTELASLPAGLGRRDSAGEHRATLGRDRGAAQGSHPKVGTQRGGTEGSPCSGLPAGLSEGAAGLVSAQQRGELRSASH